MHRRWPSLRSLAGLNDVSSATVVSKQRCEAKVLGGLPQRPLRRCGRCALRCGETGLRWVTRLQAKTVEDRLQWEWVCELNLSEVRRDASDCTGEFLRSDSSL